MYAQFSLNLCGDRDGQYITSLLTGDPCLGEMRLVRDVVEPINLTERYYFYALVGELSPVRLYSKGVENDN